MRPFPKGPARRGSLFRGKSRTALDLKPKSDAFSDFESRPRPYGKTESLPVSPGDVFLDWLVRCLESKTCGKKKRRPAQKKKVPDGGNAFSLSKRKWRGRDFWRGKSLVHERRGRVSLGRVPRGSAENRSCAKGGYLFGFMVARLRRETTTTRIRKKGRGGFNKSPAAEKTPRSREERRLVTAKTHPRIEYRDPWHKNEGRAK